VHHINAAISDCVADWNMQHAPIYFHTIGKDLSAKRAPLSMLAGNLNLLSCSPTLEEQASHFHLADAKCPVVGETERFTATCCQKLLKRNCEPNSPHQSVHSSQSIHS